MEVHLVPKKYAVKVSPAAMRQFESRKEKIEDGITKKKTF